MDGKANTSNQSASLWIGLAITLLCVVFANTIRIQQYQNWLKETDLSVTRGTPVMATLDAYYSLRWAEAFQSGSFEPHARDPLRVYERRQYREEVSPWLQWRHELEWLPQLQPKALPLLSRLLVVGSQFCDGDVHCAGIYLTPLLSSLFIIPLFLYCWRLGYPAAGVLGGLIATFCHEYYRRSGAGWADTDALNLFFPWIISFSILLMRRELSRTQLVLLSAAAGFGMHGFYLWYSRPGLAIVYGIVLIAYLFVQRVALKNILLCGVVYLIAANPNQLPLGFSSLSRFVEAYLRTDIPEVVDTEMDFPEVMTTISEVKALPWSEVFSSILNPGDGAVLGFIGFLILAGWRWRNMIPLLPIFILGLLSFYSSRRFIIYLAPFIGIGLGYLVTIVVHGLLSVGRVCGFARLQRSLVSDGAVYALVLVLFGFWLVPKTAIGTTFRPAIPAPIYAALQDLKHQLPRGSRLWTWWDMGYVIPHATGLGVYHDGGAQRSPQTFFVAKSLMDDDPQRLHNIINFVDAHGNRGIQTLLDQLSSKTALVEHVTHYKEPLDRPNIHVLFTADMIQKFSAIQYIGAWDFASGSKSNEGYKVLSCKSYIGDNLSCGEVQINLRNGEIAAGKRLRQTVLIKDGHVANTIDYPHDSGLVLQVLLKDRPPYAVYLLSDEVFRSNFNQMYLLGRYDERLFEEVYNAFPAARAFRVKR